MRVKKGYTAVELVVVLLIMTAILGIAFGFMGSLSKQFGAVSDAADNPIKVMRVISTVEEVVTGCSAITVEPQQIYVTSPKGPIYVKATDFPNVENMVFALYGDDLIIAIGGEQYCIPILKTE